ncbi:MAG: hypothetical protein K8I60_07565 [Anaerolineae bacterium]|nr:hypothetical protein [Anaerolineae bacterium]
MSILEVVLQQKIILITLIFALVPLLAAIALWLLPRLRRSRIQRQRRAAEVKAAAVAAAANAPERAAETLPVKSPLPTAAAAHPAQSTVPPQANPSTPAGQPAPQQTGAAAPAAPPTPETPTEQSGQPASSGLNDLLSVFDDDENSGQREALLKGLNPVDMAELAALSQQIAAELHTRQEG